MLQNQYKNDPGGHSSVLTKYEPMGSHDGPIHAIFYEKIKFCVLVPDSVLYWHQTMCCLGTRQCAVLEPDNVHLGDIWGASGGQGGTQGAIQAEINISL